jgi:hypothetical protein
MTCLLLAGLVWYVEPQRLLQRLQELEPGVLGFALGCGVLGIGIQWIKWQYLLVRFRPLTTWADSLGSLFVGFGLGLVSPGRLGELGRGVALGGEQSAWIGLSIVDRGCSAAITLILGWAGLAMLNLPLAVAVLGAAVLLVVAGGWCWPRLAPRLGQWTWAAQAARSARGVSAAMWLRLGCWSLLFNLVFFAQFYALLASWEPLPEGVLWGIPLFFGLKVLAPFSLMDIGVREGIALLVFAPLLLDPAVAFNAAFLQFLLNVAIPGAAGWLIICCQFHRRLGRRVVPEGVSALSLETRRSR